MLNYSFIHAFCVSPHWHTPLTLSTCFTCTSLLFPRETVCILCSSISQLILSELKGFNFLLYLEAVFSFSDSSLLFSLSKYTSPHCVRPLGFSHKSNLPQAFYTSLLYPLGGWNSKCARTCEQRGKWVITLVLCDCQVLYGPASVSWPHAKTFNAQLGILHTGQMHKKLHAGDLAATHLKQTCMLCSNPCILCMLQLVQTSSASWPADLPATVFTCVKPSVSETGPPASTSAQMMCV